MGKGRKPLPQSVKDAQGTSKACRVNNEKPESGEIQQTPPRHLSKSAKSIWRSLVGQMTEKGLLQKSDAHSLAMYCSLYDQWLEATRNVQSQGMLIIDIDGGLKKNPNFQIQTDLSKQLKPFFSEFGLTPSSREKVRVKRGEGEEDEESDEFDDF